MCSCLQSHLAHTATITHDTLKQQHEHVEPAWQSAPEEVGDANFVLVHHVIVHQTLHEQSSMVTHYVLDWCADLRLIPLRFYLQDFLDAL